MLNGMSVCSLTLWLHAAKPSSVGKTYADQDSTSNRLAFIPFILFPSVSEKAASRSKGGRGGGCYKCQMLGEEAETGCFLLGRKEGEKTRSLISKVPT